MKALILRLKDAEVVVKEEEEAVVVAMEDHATSVVKEMVAVTDTDREVISIATKKMSLMEILMSLQVKEATETVKVFHAETTIKFNQNLKIFFVYPLIRS